MPRVDPDQSHGRRYRTKVPTQPWRETPVVWFLAQRHLTTPLESKWVSQGWRAEARGIDQKLGHGIVATKSIQDLGQRVWAIPAPIIALLLG